MVAPASQLKALIAELARLAGEVLDGKIGPLAGNGQIRKKLEPYALEKLGQQLDGVRIDQLKAVADELIRNNNTKHRAEP